MTPQNCVQRMENKKSLEILKVVEERIGWYIIMLVKIQIGGFLRVLQVSSTNKTDRYDTGIAEILLKVSLNTHDSNPKKTGNIEYTRGRQTNVTQS